MDETSIKTVERGKNVRGNNDNKTAEEKELCEGNRVASLSTHQTKTEKREKKIAATNKYSD